MPRELAPPRDSVAAHTPEPRRSRARADSLRIGRLLGASPAALLDEPEDRILYLSGAWRLPGRQVFRLKATILIRSAGGAEGTIDWLSEPAGRLVGRELVTGSVGTRSVKLTGHKADPGLMPDSYQIALLGGPDEGGFQGKSRAFGQWDGRMEGDYRFVRRGHVS